MLHEVMSLSVTWEDAMSALYGVPVLEDPNPLQVYTDGSCLFPGTTQAAAGSGIYWGPDHLRNCALRLPGQEQTNNRAELYAILRCLEQGDPMRGLRIYTDSEYAIRSIAEWAPSRAELAWTCLNGDLLRDICLLIRRRLTRVTLVWVQAHGKNQHNAAADALARKGA
ncbi:ribonuclease H-like protein, partial [Exidia glandulosa HHB12029]